MRFNQRFFRERAGLSVLAIVIGVRPLNAWAARGELSYALRDGLEIALGYITYQPTQHFGYLYGMTQHDRAFLNLVGELGQ